MAILWHHQADREGPVLLYRLPFVVAMACLALTTVAVAGPDLNCRIGPIEKSYGGTKWLVYGCDDKVSVVVVTAPGNPAMPFYFFFQRDGGGYHLHGEETGDKKFTDTAYKDLSALTDSDIAALSAEAGQQ